jgi:hypothetical protein
MERRMKALEQIMKLRDRLRFQSRELGLAYECAVNVVGYERAERRIEDGKTFHYPETIGVVIESRSTWKTSVRTSDARWIIEGRKLSGPGISHVRIYREVLRELKQHARDNKARVASLSQPTKAV